MEVTTMMRFKLGLLLGFGAGWAVGSGRAAEFWHDVQQRASNRNASLGAPSSSSSGRSSSTGSAFSDRTSISA